MVVGMVVGLEFQFLTSSLRFGTSGCLRFIYLSVILRPACHKSGVDVGGIACETLLQTSLAVRRAISVGSPRAMKLASGHSLLHVVDGCRR